LATLGDATQIGLFLFLVALPKVAKASTVALPKVAKASTVALPKVAKASTVAPPKVTVTVADGFSKGSFTLAIWVGNFAQRCDFKIEKSLSQIAIASNKY
jgi:hypothetical protein